MGDLAEGGPRSVPAGGSATIYGILYQILWSLLRASRVRIENSRSNDAGQVRDVTLTLEPLGGGGDLIASEPGRRTVEQLKAKSDAGTWSLRTIVEDVLPDLYLASGASTEETRFRFVTEGRMGQWNEVYSFFQSLYNRKCPELDPLSALDDESEIRFRRTARGDTANEQAAAVLSRDSYTEHTLFQEIVRVVRKRRAIHESEDEAATQRKLWYLLGNFEFVGEQSLENVQQEIDSHLLAIVDCRDDIPRIRDSMALDLARRATSGDAKFSAADFLREHDLNATPLNDWSRLRDSAHRELTRDLDRLGYGRALDVRFSTAGHILEQWPDRTPMLAISGESGQGKSWRAFAMAIHAAPSQELTVLVEATGDADATLDRAAGTVWRRIGHHDNSLSVDRIGERVRRVVGKRFGRWLTLIIDGIQEVAEATSLARMPWEDWGVRVLFTVHPRLAERIERDSLGRCIVSRIGDFTVKELHTYLSLSFGDQWPAIPDYLKNPLKRPLLASLYRETVADSPCRPETEYELYAAFWKRLVEDNPLDGGLIKSLVKRFLGGATYPWSDSEFREAARDETALRRLERAGWVRVVPGPSDVRFEIAHDRFLNWAVAAVLVDDLRERPEAFDELADKLRGYLTGQATVGGRHLGFVPMDTLWMILTDNGLKEQAAHLLEALEHESRHPEVLYNELVPTLGPPVADALHGRLRRAVANPWLTRLLTDAIAKIEDGSTLSRAHELLHGDEPLLQRAAMRILAKRPSADELDRLWELHLAASRTPDPFLREHEGRHTLYEESFEAICACCRLNPRWLDGAIQRADPESDPVHDLAYFVRALGGEDGLTSWRRNKRQLMDKVSPKKLRSIASCIRRYADADERGWLLAHISDTQDAAGAMAMSALARIAPEDAVEHLNDLPAEEVVLARWWYADHLFVACPTEIQSKLLELMRDHDDPWKVAHVYSGREHLLDVRTVDFLLDDLDIRLEEMLAIPDCDAWDRLHMPLCLLARANTCVTAERLRQRQGMPLESKLCDLLLRIGPRQGRGPDSLIRDVAAEALYRIGGAGFTRVVNEFLTATSRYARLSAIEIAAKRPDEDTIGILAAISENEDTWDGHPREQNKAACLLADAGEWEPVLRFVERTGLDISDFPRRERRPPAEALSEVRARVRQLYCRSAPGSVLALGFGTPQEDSATVRAILADCEPESDLAHACVIALEMLGDACEESVPLLKRQLQVQKHAWSATQALIVNGTQAALDALGSNMPEELSVLIAVQLINRLESPGNAIQKIGDALESEIQVRGGWDFNSKLDQILTHLTDEKAVHKLIERASIREHVRSAAFADEGKCSFVGSKAAAIRCLARFDPPAAFLAAKTALRTPHWHDRKRYPYILMDIDPQRAKPILIEQFGVEESENVRRSICRSFLALDVEDDTISECLKSVDPKTRCAGCTIAGWAGRGEDMRTMLRECLRDEDDDVVHEAVKALDRWTLRDETQRLARAILKEQDASKRWILLDCLLDLADAGDPHHDWPVEGPAIADALSPLQIDHVTSRLNKLREDKPESRD